MHSLRPRLNEKLSRMYEVCGSTWNKQLTITDGTAGSTLTDLSVAALCCNQSFVAKIRLIGVTTK